MIHKLTLFIIFFVLIITGSLPVSAEDLTILYFKRPPYYETVNGKAQGLLVDRVNQICMDAGVEPKFIEVPPSRILYYIEHSPNPYCSIGWFKTKKREDFAVFSLPFYRNKPLVVLTIKDHQQRIEQHATIKDVFSDRELILGMIDSFSYGTVMDEWINNYSPRSHEISTNQISLPKLILNSRASYMLVAPEEIDGMIETAGLKPDLFVAVSKPDIPKGNKRYIMYSRNVNPGIIEKMDASIKKLFPYVLEWE